MEMENRFFVNNWTRVPGMEVWEEKLSMVETMSLVGCIIALAALLVLIMRNKPMLIVALVAAVIVCIFSGLNIYKGIMGPFMEGMAGYIKSYYMLFLFGALFGQVMSRSGAALGIARLFVEKLGAKFAALAIIIACAALVYGGISCFVIVFAVLPFAEKLFEEADIPRKYLPGVMAFGTVTFAMTGAGTPQVQNMIPANALGTKASAGWAVSLIVMAFMFIIGYLYLSRAIRSAKARGEHYIAPDGADANTDLAKEAPNGLLALIPLIVTVICLNLLNIPVEISILIGSVLGLVMFHKYFTKKDMPVMFQEGFTSSLGAIANTAIIVGFGSVVKAVPAFTWLTDNITKIPGSPLIGVAIAVTVIAGITGSASGGLSIAMDSIGPLYVSRGVLPEAIHRISSIASGALDSMPWNGYVVTLLNVIGITHKEGYFPVFVTTVLVPTLGTILAIILFKVAPGLPY